MKKAKSTFERIMSDSKQKKAFEKEYANFHLMDENRMGKHDYAASMSANDDHLTRSGGHVLSLRLDSLLVGLKTK